ncbi:MAG: hypothetical protein ACI89J_000970 [Hyphomicrobiaceae bacterium]|jgi:hypothetical protein
MSDSAILERPETTGALKFHRMIPGALSPMRADKAALGTLPTGAFQYCEPIRTASAYGWYVFPPDDIHLYWDGVDVYHRRDGEWELLSRTHFSSEFLNHWNEHAPESLEDFAPPYLTSIFVPGVVQIWSGLLLSAAADWSAIIGPVANMPQSPHFFSYEGIVETDRFSPWPLFTNVRLMTTDREIVLPKSKPLFQVRPLLRQSYTERAMMLASTASSGGEIDDISDLSEADWQAYRGTVRASNRADEPRNLGSYATSVRRRAKNCPIR